MTFKGAQSGKPLQENVVQKAFDTSMQRAGEPKDEQLRISYGVICDVNEDNSTVRVDTFDRGGNRTRIGSGADQSGDGALLPILQPITLIHQMFGSLRKGLVVRIYWRGKHIPGRESVVEVISDAGESVFATGRKKTRSNELAVAVHEMFMGGVSSF